jgi:glycosyltransferase involved in cell wall biosynthesis
VVDVSVIIPCRDAGPFVVAAVGTALGQTEAPREVIVADDGSSDQSAELVQSNFPGVRLLRGPFGGASQARNAALHVATGALVAFLDADDLWYPDHLARSVALIERSGDAAYSAHFDRLDEHGNRLAVQKPDGFNKIRTNLGLRDYLTFFHRGLPNSSGTYLIKRETLSAAGGFDPTQLRANDFDLWLRVIKQSTWCYDPHCAMSYRIRSQGNLSSDVASRSYFRLRALLRLRTDLASNDGPLDGLIRYWAIQAVRTAAIRGRNDDWSRALELAAGEVPVFQLALWRLVRSLGGRFGLFNSLGLVRG